MRVILGLLRSRTQTTAPLLEFTYYPFAAYWNRSPYLHFASGTPDEHASKGHCYPEYMAEGACRVLAGHEPPLRYTPPPAHEADA